MNAPAANSSSSGASQRTVCVVAPQQHAYSQTFVRAHKERLPAKIISLYAADYESLSDGEKPLVGSEFAGRLYRAVLRRSLNLDWRYFQQQALERFLLRNKTDAVLAEFAPTATLVMDACKKLDIPLVTHFHGFDAYRRKTLEDFGARYQDLFKTAAATIAVSRDMLGQLIALGSPPEKTHYNSCGVDTSIFQTTCPDQNPPTFISVGRFVEKKAPYLSLLAFKSTLEKIPEARLIMVGDGPLWNACQQMIRSLRLVEAVELRGVRSQSEVVEALRKSRAFVQHSITTQDGDSEGTPVAILEAGACGLPIVSTRHAGIKDAVIEEKTGLLVDEGDIQGMAEQMIRLAQMPSLAATLGQNAREWISTQYSMEKSINNLWSIIERAINR